MTILLSLIIPTRERASYLEHSIRTCIANPSNSFEIIVLDNASTDNTASVMQQFKDSRIRYIRNDSRLSMRDNFEKGIEVAQGEILCFIGDDDGIFPYTVETVLELFDKNNIDAIAAARAHYFWPDLVSRKKNTALLPRKHGVEFFNSRTKLMQLLMDNDYYKLPCLYHGFVRRSIVEKIKQQQNRFFLSSQVDMFSSIALSMENIQFAFSHLPLVINGASSRSNGASHFGGGTEKEKMLWKNEDDIGFLPAFTGSLTIGALIIESAIRYKENANNINLEDIFNSKDLDNALHTECAARLKSGWSSDTAYLPFTAVYKNNPNYLAHSISKNKAYHRIKHLVNSYLSSYPIDFDHSDVENIHSASQKLTKLIIENRTSLLDNPVTQIKAAIRMTTLK